MKRILLIEDDPTMRFLLKTLLQMEGFQADICMAEAMDDILTMITSMQPQIILLDAHLASASGLEIMKQIRVLDPDRSMRVLMTSGMELSDQSKAAGADDFILKPFMPDELIQKVNALA